MTTTLLICDLHLGATSSADVLRRAELRAPLIAAIAPGDRLVVLGDTLELREAAHRDASEIARPFFEEVGEALGPGGEIVLTAGNHDHGIVAGWIDGRLLTEPSGFLGLETRFTPAEAGPLAQRLAQHAQPATTTMAYPGIWLRDDVYAIHGHYGDLHSTVPTFERLAAGAMAKWVVHLPEHGATADDYEAALAPLYAWLHQLAQRAEHGLVTAGMGASARAWVRLAGEGRRKRPVRTAALGAGYYAAVATINKLGLGPVQSDLSGPSLRRGGLHGFKEALRRLGVDAPYVIWGHSHRSGPWPTDDPSEWRTHTGGQILNAGCWVYQRHFLDDAPPRSPYWPGTAIRISDSGPPELIHLLGDHTHDALRPPPRA